MNYADTLSTLSQRMEALSRLERFSRQFADAYAEYVEKVQKPGLAYQKKTEEIAAYPIQERTPLLIKELPVADRILSAAKKIEGDYPAEVVAGLKKEGDGFYAQIFGKDGVGKSPFASDHASLRKKVSADDLFLLFQARIEELLKKPQDHRVYAEAYEVIEEYRQADATRLSQEAKSFVDFVRKGHQDVVSFRGALSDLSAIPYDGAAMEADHAKAKVYFDRYDKANAILSALRGVNPENVGKDAYAETSHKAQTIRDAYWKTNEALVTRYREQGDKSPEFIKRCAEELPESVFSHYLQDFSAENRSFLENIYGTKNGGALETLQDIEKILARENPDSNASYKSFAKRFDEIDPIAEKLKKLSASYGEAMVTTAEKSYEAANKKTEDALEQKMAAFKPLGYEDYLSFLKEFSAIGFEEKYRKHVRLSDRELSELKRRCTVAENWKKTFVDELYSSSDPKKGLAHVKRFDRRIIGKSYDETVAFYRNVLHSLRADALSDGLGAVGSFFLAIGRGIWRALPFIVFALLILAPLSAIGYQIFESVMECAGFWSSDGVGGWIGSAVAGFFYGIVRGGGALFGLPFLLPGFYHAGVLSVFLQGVIGVVAGATLLLGFLVLSILMNKEVDLPVPDGANHVFLSVSSKVLLVLLAIIPAAIGIQQYMSIHLADFPGSDFFRGLSLFARGVETPFVLFFGGAFYNAAHFEGWTLDPLLVTYVTWGCFVVFFALLFFHNRLNEDRSPSEILEDIPARIPYVVIALAFLYYLFLCMAFSADSFMKDSVFSSNQGAAAIVGSLYGIVRAFFCLAGAPLYAANLYSDLPVLLPLFGALGLLISFFYIVLDLKHRYDGFVDFSGFETVLCKINFFVVVIMFLFVPLAAPALGAYFLNGNVTITMQLYFDGFIGGGFVGAPGTEYLTNPIVWNVMLYAGLIVFTLGMILHFKLSD